MRTVVPICRLRPKYRAISPKAMNITPDKKSLLSNRLNDASPNASDTLSVDFGPEPAGPTQPLDKHDSALRPSPNFTAASGCGPRWRTRQSANGRRNSTTGTQATEPRRQGATKSAAKARRHAKPYDSAALGVPRRTVEDRAGEVPAASGPPLRGQSPPLRHANGLEQTRAKVNSRSGGASGGEKRRGVCRHDAGAGEAPLRRAAARRASWPSTSRASPPPVTVEQFKGGQSNPTYRLTDGAGRRYVLRRKPPGKLLPSAHAVDREFRVISALNKTDVPTPAAYALCEDDSVVGTAFYIMEYCDGRVLWDPLLPEVPKEGRLAIYQAKFDVLARLHAVDYAALGLADFGRPGSYVARQISRWGKQYKASRDRDHRGDGQAARLAAGAPAAERRDGAGPWRLPARQHGLPSERAARAGRDRLGDLDPGRSAGRALLSLHAVAHAHGLGRAAGP